MMKCNQCGKKLEPKVTWYGEMLQVLWYCEKDRCGWVKDIYFTRSDHPSPFEEANLKGCPTDEEIQIASWSEGRGHGYFPKEGL